jgi:hypothetical protein
MSNLEKNTVHDENPSKRFAICNRPSSSGQNITEAQLDLTYFEASFVGNETGIDSNRSESN